ncbi:MAG: dienelactone hydrolase family protein [Chloroflexota bacterium]
MSNPTAISLFPLLAKATVCWSFTPGGGCGHWFFEPDRPQAYNPAAASLAWDRTLAFLRRSSTL